MDMLKKGRDAVITQALHALFKMLPYISDDRLLRFAQSRIETIPYPEGRDFIERLILLGKRALSESSPGCRKRGVENFFINSLLSGVELREKFYRENGFWPPYFFVISPTMRCNLRCYGCYAGEYARAAELEEPLVDRIITEAEQAGIFFLTISGGEPFCYEPLLRLAQKHDKVYFQVYTNGHLIDNEMAKRLAEIGNILPVISVEGFEAETDARRGPGAFKKIMAAMDTLREHKVIFGFSCTATRQNNEKVVSDEFLKFYAEKGCFIGWYFNYVPVGRGADLDLMPTPEQRLYRRARLNAVRRSCPILLADFWNDGPLIGGCIAGGSSYFHINAKGDVEPCVFVHFAVDNIRNKSLKEVLCSPLFKAIRRRQPYRKNLLLPCMIIDNPHVLRQVVHESGAHPTHPGAEAITDGLYPALQEYAHRYAALADPIWKAEYANCSLPRRRNTQT